MADNPRVIWLEHKHPTTGEPDDALMVLLEDPAGTFGIKNIVTGTVVVAAGTPVPKVPNTIGIYEYNIEALDTKQSYEFFFRVVRVDSQQYVNGIISVVTPIPTGDGPAVPEGVIGTDIDVDGDGTIDGTQYQDGDTTYVDWDGDETIDAVGHDLNGDGTIDGWTPPAKGEVGKTGTFAQGPGFDGVSGSTPSTGGYRTNRDKKGTGYWDGISFKDACQLPILPAGQCVKDKCLAMVRAMLFDIDSECLQFTDDHLDLLLEGSLWAFNAKPTLTAFQWHHFVYSQERFLDLIVKGTVIWALFAGGLLVTGSSEWQIQDNGISFTPPPVGSMMHSYASTLLQHYDAQLTLTKAQFMPLPAATGIWSTLSVMPALTRLRHLKSKRIF